MNGIPETGRGKDDDSRRQDGGVHGWRYQEAAGGRAEGLGKEGGMDTQDGRLRGRWRREGQKDRAVKPNTTVKKGNEVTPNDILLYS